MVHGIIVNMINMSFKIALVPDVMVPIAPLPNDDTELCFVA